MIQTFWFDQPQRSNQKSGKPIYPRGYGSRLIGPNKSELINIQLEVSNQEVSVTWHFRLLTPHRFCWRFERQTRLQVVVATFWRVIAQQFEPLLCIKQTNSHHHLFFSVCHLWFFPQLHKSTFGFRQQANYRWLLPQSTLLIYLFRLSFVQRY